MSNSQAWETLGLGIKESWVVLKILKNVVAFLVERNYKCIRTIYRTNDYMIVQVISYKNPCTSSLKSNYKVYSFFLINFSNNYSSFRTLCFRVLNSLLFSEPRSLLSPSSMGPTPHLQNLSCQMTDSMIVYLALMYNSSL